MPVPILHQVIWDIFDCKMLVHLIDLITLYSKFQILQWYQHHQRLIQFCWIKNLIHNLNIPIKKVAIELNKEIIDKKKIGKIKIKNNDTIEIVHFIGGG